MQETELRLKKMCVVKHDIQTNKIHYVIFLAK